MNEPTPRGAATPPRTALLVDPHQVSAYGPGPALALAALDEADGNLTVTELCRRTGMTGDDAFTALQVLDLFGAARHDAGSAMWWTGMTDADAETWLTLSAVAFRAAGLDEARRVQAGALAEAAVRLACHGRAVTYDALAEDLGVPWTSAALLGQVLADADLLTGNYFERGSMKLNLSFEPPTATEAGALDSWPFGGQA